MLARIAGKKTAGVPDGCRAPSGTAARAQSARKMHGQLQTEERFYGDLYNRRQLSHRAQILRPTRVFTSDVQL
jgi:hypothetical protein